MIQFLESGGTAYDCMEMFKIDNGAFYRAVRKGIIPKPKKTRRKPKMSAKQMGEHFIGKQGWSYRSRIKKAMLGEGLLDYKCSLCGISEWRGEPLVLRLDHIDGEATNFSVENLRLICPNCDSQQDTYCNRNVKCEIPSPPPPEIGLFVCPQCDDAFERLLRRTRDNQGKAGKAGPFCSRRCAGLFSSERQYARSLSKIIVPVAELADAASSNGAVFGRAGS